VISSNPVSQPDREVGWAVLTKDIRILRPHERLALDRSKIVFFFLAGVISRACRNLTSLHDCVNRVGISDFLIHPAARHFLTPFAAPTRTTATYLAMRPVEIRRVDSNIRSLEK
jgi:hypothetical protein